MSWSGDGGSHIYKSFGKVVSVEVAIHYFVEFLNNLDLSDMPPLSLKLKKSAVILLLRNLDQPRLCCGTHIVVTELQAHIIKANILIGRHCIILRIPLILTVVPFHFKWLQFSVRLSYALAINKSQNQTLQAVSFYLEEGCSSHGYL